MIYNLIDSNHLEHDLKFILETMEHLYDVKITNNEIIVSSVIEDKSNAFWATDENTLDFNKNIPKIKSLHTDMYAFIESYCRLRFGEYVYSNFESTHSDYKEFRLLNNMFKHPEKKTNEILLTKVVVFQKNTFDLLCCFKYPEGNKNLMYSTFIILFFKILKELDVITIEE